MTAKAALPAAMPAESVAERSKFNLVDREKPFRAYVEKQAARREELNKQIAEVSKERDAYIAAEQKKQAGKGDSFDQKVSEVIRAQAARQPKK